jgi:TRAP-type C4-dicarboxylate transport system permease small subunit
MGEGQEAAQNNGSHEVSGWVSFGRWLDRVISNGFLLKGSQGMAWASGIVMIILVLSVFLDVIGHNTPLRVPWSAGTYELAELLMSLISVLGLSYCWYREGHVRIELVLERLSPRVKALFETLASIFALIFVGAIGWRLMVLSIKALQRSEETDFMKLPVGFFMFIFSVVMLHFLLVLVRFSLQHILTIFGWGTEPTNHSGEER